MIWLALAVVAFGLVSWATSDLPEVWMAVVVVPLLIELF